MTGKNLAGIKFDSKIQVLNISVHNNITSVPFFIYLRAYTTA
jgi:hypothetical protein